MADVILNEEKVFEFYTNSGKRVAVKGQSMLTNYSAGDIIVLDSKGTQVACFILENIEGWRVAL